MTLHNLAQQIVSQLLLLLTIVSSDRHNFYTPLNQRNSHITRDERSSDRYGTHRRNFHFDPRISQRSRRSRFSVAPQWKELCPRFEACGLTAFRVIPIQTKYPRALSSCIMHTYRQQKQPPPFTARWILRGRQRWGSAAFLFPPYFSPAEYFVLFYCVATQ